MKITQDKIKKISESSVFSIPTPVIFLTVATIMVNANKNAVGRVRNPKASISAPIDSEKVAIIPKGTLNESRPNHLVKLLPNLSNRSILENNFDQP